MNKGISAVLYCLLGVLVVVFTSMFIVDQRQNAIVFRLGEVVSIKKEPGLYFKVPLLDNVRYLGKGNEVRCHIGIPTYLSMPSQSARPEAHN